jgi:hypothetical protein
LVQIVSEEPRIGQDCVICKRLHTSSRLEAGTWLVEGNVSIGPNAAEEQLDATRTLYFLFVVMAFGFQVRRVTVKDVDVVRIHIHMREEVLVHKAMIAFGVVSWKADILVLIGSASLNIMLL